MKIEFPSHSTHSKILQNKDQSL